MPLRDPLVQAELQEYVRIAARLLTKERIARPALNLAGIATEYPLGSTEHVKSLIARTAEHYGLPMPIVAVKYAVVKRHAAGHVQQRNGVWYIDIDEAYRLDAERLVVIVAHEVAHVLLERFNTRLENPLENERLTDCVAALGGFVRIMASGRFRSRTTGIPGVVSTTRTSTLGYLSREALQFLINIQGRIAERDFRRRRTPIDPRRHPILACHGCGTRARLPTALGKVRLECSVCGYPQELRLESQPTDTRIPRRLIGGGRWLALRAIDFLEAD